MKDKLVNELFWMRSVCCIAVVLLHSIASSSSLYFSSDSNPGFLQQILDVSRLFLAFATPTFVFISEFLLSRSYPQKLPDGFLKKRVKFLLFPYLFMSIVYAILLAPDLTLRTLVMESLKNILLGDSTVYFVLIIFQFYLLHILLSKRLNEWSPKYVLPITFFVNIIYLAFFNFVKPFIDNPTTRYVWDEGYYMPFFGWIFYFALGYYIGKHYELVIKKVTEYKYWVFFGAATSFSILLINRYFGYISTASSKKVDIVLYTSLIILLMFYAFSRSKSVPRFIIFVSNYSFSIYLLHKGFTYFIKPIDNVNVVVLAIITFSLSFGASILIAFLLNRLVFGKYLVGQIRDYSPSTSLQKSVPVQKDRRTAQTHVS